MSKAPTNSNKRRVLSVIDEFVHLTNEFVHDLALPKHTHNWACKQTAALRKEGLLECGRLADGRAWLRATPTAQRLLGVPIRRHRDKGEARRLGDLAIVEHCLNNSPRLRRIRVKQQLDYLTDVPEESLKRPICLAPDTGVLDLVFVRCDVEVAAITRDCWKYVKWLTAHPSAQKLLAAKKLRLVVITATRSYAAEIQAALDRGPAWPLPRLVLSCPLLMQLHLISKRD